MDLRLPGCKTEPGQRRHPSATKLLLITFPRGKFQANSYEFSDREPQSSISGEKVKRSARRRHRAGQGWGEIFLMYLGLKDILKWHFLCFLLLFRAINHKPVVSLASHWGEDLGREGKGSSWAKSLQTALICLAKPQKCRNYKEKWASSRGKRLKGPQG